MAIRADDVDLGRDKALVEQFQAGDVAGFEDLYRRYYSRLYRFCLKRVGDSAEAEEVTQEAFARAYTAMPRLAGERKFYPWLSVIAARLCLDTHRRRARSVPFPELDLGAVEGDQEKVVLQAADRQMLRDAMDRLGPRHQEVLRLREQEGWSYQRIAEYYAVSLGTVEQLLWRARRALRREFEVVAGADARTLAGLPVLGWLARRIVDVRARLSGWSEHAVAPLATNAVSLVMVVTSAVVLAAGAGSSPVPAQQINAGRPPAVHVQTAAPEPAVEAPAATAPATGSAATNTPPAAAASEDAGMQPVGPTPLLYGTDEQGRQESADHPARVEALDTWVTANPNAVLEPLAQFLGGSQ
jgi:RNA polymerase sigma-70 factor (ECF subfamily)